MIDWNKPIEAVHKDGRVMPVKAVGHSMRTVDPFLEDDGLAVGFFRRDGTHNNPRIRWRIRNVAPTTSERDPALWDRMEALVREMGKSNDGMHNHLKNKHYDEARAIVAELPKPVDPDLIEARKIVITQSGSVNPAWIQAVKDGDRDSNDESVQIALAAIRRGRALQRGEA